MNDFLLSVHVLGAILAIGPVAVAASMFPPAARRAFNTAADGHATAVVRLLHRITRVYAVVGIIVPVFGVATAAGMGILTQAWLLVSMALTAVAAIVLISLVLPGQKRVLAGLENSDGQQTPELSLTTRLSMATGIFNLLWGVVVVMMIYRPGQESYV